MQYTEKISALKIENLIEKMWLILICLLIDCRGGSNEYPQSMFWNKNKNNRYTPLKPQFFSFLKWGSRGYTLHGQVCLMINVWFKGVFNTRTCYPYEQRTSKDIDMCSCKRILDMDTKSIMISGT